MFARFEHHTAERCIRKCIADTVKAADILAVDKYLVILVAAKSLRCECQAIASRSRNIDCECEVIVVIGEISDSLAARSARICDYRVCSRELRILSLVYSSELLMRSIGRLHRGL